MDAKFLSQFIANSPAVQIAQSVIGSLPIGGQSTGSSKLNLTRVASSAQAAGGISEQASLPPASRRATASPSAFPANQQKAARAPVQTIGADAGETIASIKSLRLKGFKNEEPSGAERKVDEEAKDVIDLARSLRLKGFSNPANDQ